MADKKTEEKETAIEKLNDNLSSAGQKVAEHKKVIFIGIGVIAVIAAFVISYLFIYRSPRLQHAAEEFNNVEVTAQNDSAAAAGYMKVSKEYSGSDAGKLAALAAAESLLNQASALEADGKAKEAQAKYKEALAQLENADIDEPLLKVNAIVLKGDCYVNLGEKNYAKALECYEEAIKKCDKNPQVAPRVLLKQANIYDAQKKYADALKCYQTIQSEYPQFAPGNGMTIEAYIARENARLGK